MERAFAAIAVATALHLLAAAPCAASARPLPVATRETTSALAPVAADQAVGDDDVAAREGKWLPFAGPHHLPPAYWAHKPVPWVGAAAGASQELGGAGAGAVEAGEGEEDQVAPERGERRRLRPSYGVGEGTTTTTRQEQLAMWASLLNPKGRGRSAAGWLPAPALGGVADDEPAKASDATAVEGAEGDETSAGQNYWGNNGN